MLRASGDSVEMRRGRGSGKVCCPIGHGVLRVGRLFGPSELNETSLRAIRLGVYSPTKARASPAGGASSGRPAAEDASDPEAGGSDTEQNGATSEELSGPAEPGGDAFVVQGLGPLVVFDLLRDALCDAGVDVVHSGIGFSAGCTPIVVRSMSATASTILRLRTPSSWSASCPRYAEPPARYG
jgi:hypothetical protein